MSNFTCQQCGTALPKSRTICKRHPMARVTRIDGNVITHVLPDGRVNRIVCGEPLRAGVVYS